HQTTHRRMLTTFELRLEFRFRLRNRCGWGRRRSWNRDCTTTGGSQRRVPGATWNQFAVRGSLNANEVFVRTLRKFAPDTIGLGTRHELYVFDGVGRTARVS